MTVKTHRLLKRTFPNCSVALCFFWFFLFLFSRPRLHSFFLSLSFSPLSFSVLLHISLHYKLLLFLLCAEIQTQNQYVGQSDTERVSQPWSVQSKSFALRSASLHFQSVSLPIWHPSSLPHGNRKARIGQIKPTKKKKKKKRVRVRDIESVWGWLQIKGQHSRNSSLLRASSPSPPPLRFREEMVSPAPEDLQTSWAGPPSLSDLQHPDLCHQRTVHAQRRSVTIGCMHVSAGVFGLCYVRALARDRVSTCFCLDSRASVPSVLCGYACVCLQMYASYLQYVFDV